jgi:hypothetical protein
MRQGSEKLRLAEEIALALAPNRPFVQRRLSNWTSLDQDRTAMKLVVILSATLQARVRKGLKSSFDRGAVEFDI